MFSLFGAVDYENRVDLRYMPADSPKRVYITDHAFFMSDNTCKNRAFTLSILNFNDQLYTLIYNYGFSCIYEEQRQKLFLFQDAGQNSLFYTYNNAAFVFSDKVQTLEEYIKTSDTVFAPIKTINQNSLTIFSREGLKIYN